VLTLTPGSDARPLRRILCLGAHCDDIEIGCGATLLELLAARPGLAVDWVVLSSNPVRRSEAETSAREFLSGAGEVHVDIREFRNGYFPHVAADIKDFFETLKRREPPDLVLTHFRGDRHQDHRTVGELTWNTYRDHWVLEYEIPKYDGDLGRPNCYVPVSAAARERKIDLILEHFASQADKQWFSADTFRALMRLRGIECAAPDGHAEAFHASKLTLAP